MDININKDAGINKNKPARQVKKSDGKRKFCFGQYELIDRDDSYLGESATCYIARFAEKNC